MQTLRFRLVPVGWHVHTCPVCGDRHKCKAVDCPQAMVACSECRAHLGGHQMDYKETGLILSAAPERDARNHSGTIIIAGNEVADTISCCHCDRQWVPVKGSGKIRGWCGKCNRPHCGRKKCEECVPYEKVLLAKEKKDVKILTSVTASTGA